jgi:ferredoxin-NADP reductase
VQAVRQETNSARTLVLEMSRWPGHRAGQHVDVRLTAPDGYQAQRSYSIASAPGRPLELCVERLDDGEVSPYLVDVVGPGDVLELRGPIGGWFVWEPWDRAPLALVAGGSGLVPLAAMLRHRRDVDAAPPASLLLSARTADDVLFAHELETLGATVTVTLTRADPPGWPGPTRRVDATMLEAALPSPDEQPRCFVCGPTAFVEQVASALLALGHAPDAIRTERFGPTGG